jgi:L-aminopeptidase/D-esterase-like protein
MLVEEAHAILLTGGSAFGLAAADGVVRHLEESGIGFDTGVARVPIVPAAVLFDLALGNPKARPGPHEGYEATARASTEVPQGNVGAGTGATVSKHTGPHNAIKGGLGTASTRDGDLIVGVLAAVNAFGDILDEHGDPMTRGAEPGPPGPQPQPPNTTLAVIATNAKLSKERTHLLALAAQDALAATIKPAHTIWDGDTVFSLATGTLGGTEAPQRVLEDLVERALAEAIRSAIRHAESVPGAPSIRELQGGTP